VIEVVRGAGGDREGLRLLEEALRLLEP